MGQSRRKASARASEGRESMLMTLPSRSIQMTAKKVSSRSSFTTILWTCVSRPISRFLIRSWVMGRGVVTFSISSAMAFASYTPTHMGSTVSLPTSLSTTMGILVTGSIINPRIFISTSMMPSLQHQFTQKAVGETFCYQHVNISAYGWNQTFRGGKVQGNVLAGSSYDLPPGLILSFNHYLINTANPILIIGPLDFTLAFLKDLQTL